MTTTVRRIRKAAATTMICWTCIRIFRTPRIHSMMRSCICGLPSIPPWHWMHGSGYGALLERRRMDGVDLHDDICAAATWEQCLTGLLSSSEPHAQFTWPMVRCQHPPPERYTSKPSSGDLLRPELLLRGSAEQNLRLVADLGDGAQAFLPVVCISKAPPFAGLSTFGIFDRSTSSLDNNKVVAIVLQHALH